MGGGQVYQGDLPEWGASQVLWTLCIAQDGQ